MNSGEPALPVDEFSTHMGGRKPLPLLSSSGLCGASSGAKSATNMKKRMTSAPATAALLCSKRVQASRQKERDGRESARVVSAAVVALPDGVCVWAVVVMTASLYLDARIKEPVHDIDREVCHHDQERVDQGSAHDHGIIAVADGGHILAAAARKAEH